MSAENSYEYLEQACTSDISPLESIETITNVKNLINNLLRESEHCRPNENYTVARTWALSNSIHMWLCGYTPPPRCSAIVFGGHQCIEVATLDGGYCSLLHSCHSEVEYCREQRISATVKYCENHRCKKLIKNNSCDNERLEHGDFCVSHSCPICIVVGDFPIRSAEPYACLNHQCAEANGRCKNPRIQPQIFCLDHCCIVCAQTGDTRGLPRMAGLRVCKEHKCAMEKCGYVRLNSEIAYCTNHLCVACAPDMIRHADVECPESRLCPDHRCQHPEEPCQNQRDPSSPLYCWAHTCRVCRDIGQETFRPVIEEFPRNHCIDHPLCNRVFKNGNMCHAVAVNPPGHFCVEHTDVEVRPNKNRVIVKGDGQCCGINRKNMRCKTKGFSDGGGKWFCKAHQDQASEGGSDLDSVEGDEPEEFGQDESKGDESGNDKDINLSALNSADSIKLKFSIMNIPTYTPNCELSRCVAESGGNHGRCNVGFLVPLHSAHGNWCCPKHENQRSRQLHIAENYPQTPTWRRCDNVSNGENKSTVSTLAKTTGVHIDTQQYPPLPEPYHKPVVSAMPSKQSEGSNDLKGKLALVRNYYYCYFEFRRC